MNNTDKKPTGWTQWGMPGIPALRGRQENQKFKSSLGYVPRKERKREGGRRRKKKEER